MDKVSYNYDPKTGEIRDNRGNVVCNRKLNVDGVLLDRGVLADAICQGCKYMEQERDAKDTDPDRRAFLDANIRLLDVYHTIILGCSEDEAKKLIAEYQKGII